VIQATARLRHYIDHLAPVWLALDEGERAGFYVPQKLVTHAASKGVRATGYRGELPPLDPALPVLVASTQDHRRARGRDKTHAQQQPACPVVYMAHGNGQSFSFEHDGYAGGKGRDGVILFLAVNEHYARAWRTAYPHVPVEIIGCPKLDRVAAREHRPADTPTVAISFHWLSDNSVPETWSAWSYYREAVEALVASKPAYRIVGHGHPKNAKNFRRWWGDLRVEWVNDFDDVLDRADLYVNDCSSTLYEFAATGRPVVVLNIPDYRVHVEHGLRFWEYADVGVQVVRPDDLAGAIGRALDDGPAQRERRREVTAHVFPHFGAAATRAAAAIRDLDRNGAADMVQVRLLTSFAGPSATHDAGDTLTVSRAEARRLLAGGYAEPVAVKPVDRAEVRSDAEGPADTTIDIDSLKRPGLLREAKRSGIPARGSNDELRAALKAQQAAS
jgi:hypothetical protein